MYLFGQIRDIEKEATIWFRFVSLFANFQQISISQKWFNIKHTHSMNVPLLFLYIATFYMCIDFYLVFQIASENIAEIK